MAELINFSGRAARTDGWRYTRERTLDAFSARKKYARNTLRIPAERDTTRVTYRHGVYRLYLSSDGVKWIHGTGRGCIRVLYTALPKHRAGFGSPAVHFEKSTERFVR
ncbi:hypothetical protein EVAR_8877_1 [Eumeta japonica]|uniref:Uncharacterized protein n=1 Tax=Eumeta variegata TaxID=151549 RepID=A0A4C1U0F9_EUMVA|nr:hypothetical protein EVAR_8877_1 [Eumeta japonica]